MENSFHYYNKALDEYSANNFYQAMYFFNKSLNEKYDSSMYHLGLMYELGLGTKDKEPDLEKAIYCYNEAYNSGVNNAVNCVRRIYNNKTCKQSFFAHKYPHINFHEA